VTGYRRQRESAGRTNGALVNTSRGILAFPLSGSSLFVGDMESLYLLVVLLSGTGVQT